MSRGKVKLPDGKIPYTPAGGYWYRCSRVDLAGDMVRWKLAPASRYSFFEAYGEKDPPHHQLVKVTDDAALRSFMETWGPLYFSWPWESAWGNAQPIARHREQRDGLIAMASLLASVDERAKQRAALTRWLEVVRKAGNDGSMLVSLRQALHLPGDDFSGFDQSFRNWLESATSMQIESAIVGVVPLLSPVGFSQKFFVDRVGRRNIVRAEHVFDSLAEAIQWMVWRDYFDKRPYQFCEECGKVFGVRGGHKRKFCPDGPCAHRRAAREWYQSKHPPERKAKGER